MQQLRVDYKDILALGFKELIEESDSIYFDQHGFYYSIISLKLARRVYLYWDKATGFVKLTTLGKDHSVISNVPLYDLNAVKTVMSAYSKRLKRKRFSPGQDIVYWKDEYRKCMESPHYFFTEYFSSEYDKPLEMNKEVFDKIFQSEKHA